MSIKILVADDEASHRQMIEAVLAAEGYEVAQAEDGHAEEDSVHPAQHV